MCERAWAGVSVAHAAVGHLFIPSCCYYLPFQNPIPETHSLNVQGDIKKLFFVVGETVLKKPHPNTEFVMLNKVPMFSILRPQ